MTMLKHKFYKIFKIVGITIGALALIVGGMVAYQELSSGGSAEAFAVSESTQRIMDKYEHEQVQNFECSTNGGFMSAKDAVEVSWDAPEAFSDDPQYFIQANVVDLDGNRIERIEEYTTDNSFTYSFSDLEGDLAFGEGYELFFYVNAHRPDGMLSPASTAAHVMHWQHAQSDTSIETCEG